MPEESISLSTGRSDLRTNLQGHPPQRMLATWGGVSGTSNQEEVPRLYYSAGQNLKSRRRWQGQGGPGPWFGCSWIGVMLLRSLIMMLGLKHLHILLLPGQTISWYFHYSRDRKRSALEGSYQPDELWSSGLHLLPCTRVHCFVISDIVQILSFWFSAPAVVSRENVYTVLANIAQITCRLLNKQAFFLCRPA